MPKTMRYKMQALTRTLPLTLALALALALAPTLAFAIAPTRALAQVAEAAVLLGMDVVGYDPTISVDEAWRLPHSVRRVDSLQKAAAVADFLTVHEQARHATVHATPPCMRPCTPACTPAGGRPPPLHE